MSTQVEIPIDGWFAMLKNAIRGVHHDVSHKWLQGYINECVWRYNAASRAGRCSATCWQGRWFDLRRPFMVR
jgi:hypothetical protein